MGKLGHYKMFGGVRYTFELETYSWKLAEDRKRSLKKKGYLVRIVEGKRHGQHVNRVYKKKRRR